ncbi:hypothetical protein RND71_024326 [Anisodus tanguticus]|uniref:F-box domain-containing protein n=1 Tax=Anisodus tanguticus TaxID=243964 RepID=A0AAE1RN24_9SOLA|nr:hypothetical protein RND71_024326 [Anisodus tanguticus]
MITESSFWQAEKIAGNDDLLREILIWLPVSSLLCFRCVSHHWRSLISDPDFRLLHTRRSSAGATAGLFLFRKSDKSTNGYTNIPQPNIDDDDEIVAMNLGFDPSKSSNYKIVCIVRDKLELFRFFIFSSDTTIWKESGQVRGDFYFGRGVFLNGVIYFVSKHSHFLYFDLDNESLEIMPSSSVPEGRNGGKIKYFGESAGKLHLIEENVLRPTLLNVFELEKDYSKWFVKYVVDLDDLTHVFPLMVINEPESLDVIGYQFDVLCFIDGEKEGKTILVLSLPEKMISYDIKSMSIKELLKVPLEELHLSMEGFLVYNYKWYHAYKHIETLALV